MIGENQGGFPAGMKTLPESAAHVQLFLEPQRDSEPKTPQPRRGKGEVSFEQAIEFGQGFIIKDDIIELLVFKAGFLETISDRMSRKTRIVLLAGESLFLGSGDNITIHDQGGGTVMIKCRDA